MHIYACKKIIVPNNFLWKKTKSYFTSYAYDVNSWVPNVVVVILLLTKWWVNK